VVIGRVRRLAVVALVPVAMVAGCGTRSAPDAGSPPYPTPAATETPGATATTEPRPSPTRSPVPTAETLQAHLDSILDGYYGIDGSLACAESGLIGPGSALTCQRSYADGPGWVPPDVTVLVAVLDDTGRYTFTIPAHGPCAAPGDYPAGTISCRTLIDPPASSDRQERRGLSYPALLHYWMSMGRPSSMDDDANGLPCETVYPADIVERASASPLVPWTGPAPRPVTLEDVRAHAEAVISGLSGGEIWLGEHRTTPDGDRVHVPETRCSSDDAARAGSTLLCAVDNDVPGWAAQAFQVYISILDDAGRYALAWQCCCMECPNLSQYPPHSTCDDLSQAPRGEEGQYGREGIRYGQLLYRWMTLGRPGDWDSDGDGRPCEDHWPVDEIDRVINSTLRP
jgi:hypothetical protein